MLKNGAIYKTMKDDSYWYNEDKNGWYGEFEMDYECFDEYDMDGHIIFNSIWMIRMNSFSGWTFSICYRNEWIM